MATPLTSNGSRIVPATLRREAQEQKPTLYTLTPLLDKAPFRLRVQIEFSTLGANGPIRLQMPTWSPGDYHLQNHAQFVQELTASDVTVPGDKNPLMVTHPDADTWEVEPEQARKIEVSYTLPTTPPGFFSQNVQVLENQVFLNGTAAYLYRVGEKASPALLRVRMPEGWQVVTPLPARANSEENLPQFEASDYDTLADSPVVMAAPDALTLREFTASGVKHRIAYFGKKHLVADFDAYTPVIKRVAEAENRIMGDSPPYKQYCFFFDVGGYGGGLEHLNSCRIAIRPSGDPVRAATFFAHEFFHLWNIKRIRPKVLGPFDYIHPPRTRNLWFAEGVTEYFAQVAVRRAELWTEAQFLEHWHRAIGAMQNTSARRSVTADESSLRVWEGKNSQGYGGLSYYDKGELIGLCLDLKIRAVTQNQKSLDDVMRLLMARHNLPKPGYGEDEIRNVVSEVAGQDLSAFYDTLARSTQEMPFAECLGYAGLDLDLHPLPDATPEQIALRKSWAGAFPLKDKE